MRAKLFPKVVTNEQEARLLFVFVDTLQHLQDESNFLNKMVAVNEIYIYDNYPESKRQRADWYTPLISKARERLHRLFKSCLFLFLMLKELICKEFFLAGQ